MFVDKVFYVVVLDIYDIFCCLNDMKKVYDVVVSYDEVFVKYVFLMLFSIILSKKSG